MDPVAGSSPASATIEGWSSLVRHLVATQRLSVKGTQVQILSPQLNRCVARMVEQAVPTRRDRGSNPLAPAMRSWPNWKRHGIYGTVGELV